MNKIYRNMVISSLFILPMLNVPAHSYAGINNHKKQVVYSYNKKSNTTTKETINDDLIVSQIKSKIEEEPLLRSVPIEISSDYGNVVVTGLVDTKLQVEKIITFAQSNKWVKSIDEKNLKVKNSHEPLTDTYVTAKVKGMLIRDNILAMKNPNDIRVETKERKVYLSGSPKTQAQIDEILKSVKSVEGVKEVENGIKVKK